MKIYVVCLDGSPEGLGTPEAAYTSRDKAEEYIRAKISAKRSISVFNEYDFVVVETDLHGLDKVDA